ncbi:M12 family metallopeptidase [Paracoccus actinidiae]|uniref:M12 family metallopeptidase n=1 Tax=Paracoccus actinidiae TaxID=3064531 RepID=UPI0027D30EF6|nr:M12 family metallopeptidase [Paracoccus sp. M09]
MIRYFTGCLGVLFYLGLAQSAAAQDFSLARASDELRSPGQAEGVLETAEIEIGGEIYEIGFATDASGNAIYQGDLVLGTAAELFDLEARGGISLQGLEEGDSGLFGVVTRNRSLLWPGGRVPYRIDASVPRNWVPRVRQAIRHWESRTAIRFDEITGSPRSSHVVFFDDPNGNSCQTTLGRPQSGPRMVQLANWCQWGNIAHEIGHVLGMHHENARSDRTNFIEIAFSSTASSLLRAQFDADPQQFQDVGRYCYDSIMHYGRTDAAGSFVITPKANSGGAWTGNPARIGQRRGLAACDIATINALYGFDQAPLQDAQNPAMMAAAQSFEGDLLFQPEGCEAERHCLLVNDLTYADAANMRWKASRRDPGVGAEVLTGTTDGASIPDWAQPLIGQPFESEFIKAAVVHDHYTYPENRVRSYWRTQRVFYEMLLDEGVSEAKARIMYLAVLLGGRKWIELVPGDSCGEGCLNDLARLPGGVVSMRASDPEAVKVSRDWPETYGTAEFDDAMRRGLTALALYGEAMTSDDVEMLAAVLQPDQAVYALADRYALEGTTDPLLDEEVIHVP